MRECTIIFVVLLLCRTLAAQGFYADSRPQQQPTFVEAPQILVGALRAKNVELTEKNRVLLASLEDALQELARLKSQTSANATTEVEEPWSITLESTPGCHACDTWWKDYRPRYQQHGWVVPKPVVVKSAPKGQLFPRWRLCGGGKCSIIENCPLEAFDERVRTTLESMR